MLVPDNEWIHAPHLVFEARAVLAGVRSLSERLHADAYSIPSVAIDLGARVKYLSEPKCEMIGQCTRDGDGLVITLNDAMENTAYDMAGLVHELGHAALRDMALGCTGKLKRIAERNAWLRGIYVAISRPLAELVLDGGATVREIAARCSIPEPLVRIRIDLAVAAGERPGYSEIAYERIKHDLLALEEWMDDGRSWGFREPSERPQFRWA